MKSKKKKILLIEDDRVDQLAFQRLAHKREFLFDYDISSSIEEAKSSLKSKIYDVIVSDFSLGDGTAFDILKELKEIPLIITTGTGNEEIAVKAMKLGAYDYLIKDVDGFYLKMLPVTVENVINRFQAEKELREYHENLEKLIEARTADLKKEIIERKHVEEELREYYNIINRSPAVVFLWKNSEGWPVEYVSENVKDLFGYTAEEFRSGKIRYSSVVYSEDLETVSEEVSTYSKYKKRNKFTQIYRIITKDSKIKWIDDRTLIRRNEKGKITHYQGIVLDITERKKNEEKIKQKSNHLLLLSKASTEINKVLSIEIILQQLVKIGIQLTSSTSGAAALFEDNKMVFTSYNNEGKIFPIDFKFKKNFGVPGLIIKTKKPFITNEAKNDKHVNQEIRKELNFHQLIAVPILNKKGELLGCFEINNTKEKRPYNEDDIEILQGLSASAAVAIENAQIILERKKTEKVLKESEERYRSLFEDSIAGVYISSFEGKLLDCNEAFVKMFGYSSKEELKKVLTTQYYKNINERDIFLKKIKEKGTLVNYVEKLKKKDGSFIWTLHNVRQHNNRIQGTVVDISADIESRNALIQAKEKAEEINRIKSNFLANMSHELRTPMVGILGFTEILEDEIENPELQEYASFIHEAANRLTETLNLILNLTKIEAEKINIELSKIDIIQNIKKNISIFDKMADSKNIYLKIESTVEQFETETDERMFDQIITNLVNNAVKFTEKGGVTVTVDKVKNNSYIEIKVTDTGIGIPKDKQEVIWEEFRQISEGISRVYEGTGLGLTITNNFVNQLGGQIRLESELGKGSTFTVLLPIRVKSILTKTKEPAFDFDKTTVTPKTKDTQKELKTLLYVDDDKISREVVKRFLRGIYKIDLALNGGEGVEKARDKKYDGILMDINLHYKMDGTIAAEKIKKMEGYKDVPIIAVTAYAMAEDREKYLEAGLTDYISKPFAKYALIELLKGKIQEKN